MIHVLGTRWTRIPPTRSSSAARLGGTMSINSTSLLRNAAARVKGSGMALFKRYLGKQFQDAYLLGLGGPMQDGDDLYNLVSSKGRGLYYKNEHVDQLFDEGHSTMDPAKRRKIYADLARAMVEDATWVFLMQQMDIYATRERVTWKPRGDQWMPLDEAIVK